MINYNKTAHRRISCVLASVICLISLVLTMLEFVGVVKIVHPLFWLPIVTGSLGVAGSTYIQSVTEILKGE